MKPALHVQIIRTHWTKRSRGAPAATARARVPLALPVAVAALQRGQLTVETYNFGEPDFARSQHYQTEVFDLSANLRYEHGAFSFDWNGKIASTFWQWSAYNVGAPQPNFSDREMGYFEIAPNDWIRLRWRGRFSDQDTGKWWYEQTVVNVARCDDDLNVDFAGEPARGFEWLPQLR